MKGRDQNCLHNLDNHAHTAWPKWPNLTGNNIGGRNIFQGVITQARLHPKKRGSRVPIIFGTLPTPNVFAVGLERQYLHVTRGQNRPRRASAKPSVLATRTDAAPHCYFWTSNGYQLIYTTGLVSTSYCFSADFYSGASFLCTTACYILEVIPFVVFLKKIHIQPVKPSSKPQ